MKKFAVHSMFLMIAAVLICSSFLHTFVICIDEHGGAAVEIATPTGKCVFPEEDDYEKGEEQFFQNAANCVDCMDVTLNPSSEAVIQKTLKIQTRSGNSFPGFFRIVYTGSDSSDNQNIRFAAVPITTNSSQSLLHLSTTVLLF